MLFGVQARLVHHGIEPVGQIHLEVEIPTQSDPFIPIGKRPPIPVESAPRGLK